MSEEALGGEANPNELEELSQDICENF